MTIPNWFAYALCGCAGLFLDNAIMSGLLLGLAGLIIGYNHAYKNLAPMRARAFAMGATLAKNIADKGERDVSRGQ